MYGPLYARTNVLKGWTALFTGKDVYCGQMSVSQEIDYLKA